MSTTTKASPLSWSRLTERVPVSVLAWLSKLERPPSVVGWCSGTTHSWLPQRQCHGRRQGRMMRRHAHHRIAQC